MSYFATTANSTSLDVTSILVGTLGGLALFLYGMHKMSDGLKAVAGDSMKTLLSKLTTNRFTAAITGAVVTAVLQSSSITTVLVVGFVSAGLMKLAQTVGIIMGANVGTTVTAQMLAFNITDWAWLMIGFGFVSWSFARRDVLRDVGTMVMGLGMLFIGMNQMGEATSPLRTHQPFIELMAQMDQVLLAMLVGAVFTALVQSSSATIGIVIMLATQGHISLEAGIAISIGAKVGTCITALLAGLGKPAEARRVGVVHVLFNLLGACIWIPFIDHLGTMATAISPVSAELTGTERLAAETPRQIANAITLYASFNLLVMIWFTSPIAKLAVKLVPDSEAVDPNALKPKYLDPVFLKTPALAIENIRRELYHIGEQVVDMFETATEAVAEGTLKDLDSLEDMDQRIDYLHTEVLNYISILSREELKTSETHHIENAIEIANNLEAIGDLIKTSFANQGRRRIENDLTVSAEHKSAIEPLYLSVAQALKDVLKALAEDDRTLAGEIIGRRSEIQRLSEDANESITRELTTSDSKSIIQFRIESDIIDQITRLYYHMRRIANAIAE